MRMRISSGNSGKSLVTRALSLRMIPNTLVQGTMSEWENGEVTYEPLNVIAADDPVTCAIYARENKLLNQDGWRHF